MFLLFEDGVVDFDLPVLIEFLESTDRLITRISDEASRSVDPDSYGYFDRIEGVVGFGFMACQQYINATYPHLSVPDKGVAIRNPPTHSSGRAVVEVINAAANFWKHHDEWPGRKRKDDEERTRAVIDAVTPSSDDYVMMNVLYELTRSNASLFSSVVPLLTQWRDLLIGQASR